MKTSKPLLLAIALVCIALLGAALYLQFVKHMLPCPWCVIQRYAYVAVALICLVSMALPAGGRRIGAGLGSLAALAGAGAAVWLIWVQAHPEVTCGIDPMETSLNTFPTAQWLPFLFKADGFCTTEYPPILGLSIPQWSLFWFLVFAIALGWAAMRGPDARRNDWH